MIDAPRAAPPPAKPSDGLRAYLPELHAEDIVGVQISAFTILALLGAARTGGRVRQQSGDREAGELVVTEVESADEGLAALEDRDGHLERGDASWTWRWPGTLTLDRVSRQWPERIAHRSPLIARVMNDAGYLRAMLGSGSLLLLAAGAVLGVLAVLDVGGDALPPSFALAVALAVLGVFDALAGVVAVAVFVAGVIVSGGLVSADAARTLLGIATLWFAAPLIAGTARPLRRPRTMSFEEHFDRTADIVIASLVGAWAVQTIIQGLPGLSGFELPIAERAGAVALLVLAALTVRMLIETVAAHWYPLRLARVQPVDLGEPSQVQRVAANLLVLAIFLFVAVSYLGSCWQLYAGGVLFVLPKLLGLAAHRFPTSPRLRAVTPRGIVQVVLLLVVGVTLGTLLLGRLEDGRQLIRDSFVLLSLPGAIVAVLELLGGDGPERQFKWQHQLLLGLPVIALGVLLALGVIG